MEPVISSDDSCDSEVKNMKDQLTEFGLDDENLSKEEMTDLLKALNNSKTTAHEDDIVRQKADDNVSMETSPKKVLKRRYVEVSDRRMPWCILPPDISQAEKARTLAVYIKLMSINNYRQARLSPNFTSWPPPIQIIEETTRIQPLRSTRSGRSVPIYSGFDDDSNDLDFVVTKTKKRKVSTSDNNGSDGVYSNKVISLKRKTKEENNRPVKEVKLNSDNNKIDSTSGSHIKAKKDIIYAGIED